MTLISSGTGGANRVRFVLIVEPWDCKDGVAEMSRDYDAWQDLADAYRFWRDVLEDGGDIVLRVTALETVTGLSRERAKSLVNSRYGEAPYELPDTWE